MRNLLCVIVPKTGEKTKTNENINQKQSMDDFMETHNKPFAFARIIINCLLVYNKYKLEITTADEWKHKHA